tara:strand:+ start:434 stop:3319 length:2886 start_codon:yes stop_codon:yes gene_type:complete
MADAKVYAEWIVNNKDKQGTPEFQKVAEAYQLSKSVDPVGIQFQNKQKTMDDFSSMQRFKYEWDTTETFTENASILLESLIPVGNIFASETGYGFYASPTELYGEDFMDLSVNERRERIQATRAAEEKKQYPILSELSQTESTGKMGMLGAFLGALSDVTTLTPVGKTPRAMAAIGGLVGGGFEATRGLAEEGKIDPLMTATMAAGGAVLAPVVDKAVRSIAPAYNSLKTSMNTVVKPAQQKNANKIVDSLNSKIMELQNEGISDGNLLLAAATRMDLDYKKVNRAIGQATESIDIPEPEVTRALTELKDAFETSNQGTFKGTISGLYRDYVQTMQQRLNSLDEGIGFQQKKLEYNLREKNQEFKNQALDFFQLETQLPKSIRPEFTKRLYNDDYAGAEQLAIDNGVNSITVDRNGNKYTTTVKQTLDNVKKVYRDIYNYVDNAVEHDLPFYSDVDYFHRKVIDRNGIRNYYGLTAENALLKSMEGKKAQILKKEIADLTEAEKNNVMDHFLSGSTKYIKGKPGAFKQRKIDVVDDELMRFYSPSASDSLLGYINSAVNHVEKYKFFNKGGVVKKNEPFNVTSSIGAYAQKLKQDGVLTERGETELRTLMEARFGAGEQSPNAFINNMKALSNMILLGNPISATTQLGDLFVNAYRHGGRNAFKGVIESISGKNVLNLKDYGLENHISQEFSDVSSLSKALDTVFKVSGFRAVDRLGKNSALQSAWNKNTGLAKTEKGIEKLRSQWGKSYGKEFDSVVNDLAEGKVTQNTKLLLFTELTGSQPLTLSDMPLKYLQAPNGRIFYALKSFGIKQLELLHNTIYKQAQDGNYYTAGKNALSYAAIVGLGNATVQEAKNWMQGREFQVDRVPDNFVNYMLSTALTSRYSVDKNLQQGDVAGVIVDSLSPPLNVFSNLSKDLASSIGNLINGEELEPRAARSIPMGRWLYNLFGGGAEEFLERQED